MRYIAAAGTDNVDEGSVPDALPPPPAVPADVIRREAIDEQAGQVQRVPLRLPMNYVLQHFDFRF